jgi:quercetin dioxygenase-like cupin family protein/ribosome-associated toxin RatA of RatAB toxin-antitoxin module
MAAYTENDVIIDAPIGFVWAITNDVRGWPDLFTEYSSVEVLDEGEDRVRFRLSMHPDADGTVWSWVSERTWNRDKWLVRAHRVETGPFEYMHILWRYEELAPDRTRMLWRQDFAMKPEAPIDDAGMRDRLNRNTTIQMAAIKERVEARRRRVVDFTDVPANRRRGGDLRTLLSPNTVGSTAGFAGAVRLAPGERVTEHYHPYSEEFLYVVEGDLRVDLDGEPKALRANQTLFIPIQARHRLVNVGGGPAVVVFFLSPLAPRPDLGHVDTESVEELAGSPS